MDNCILDERTNDTIAFYKDMVALLENQASEALASHDYEQAKDVADILLDLNGWADNTNLLVLSDNNGMGWTIKEYKGE